MHASDWLNTFTSIDLSSRPLLSGSRISSSGPGVKENTTRTSVALSPAFTPLAARSIGVFMVARIGGPFTMVNGIVPALTDASTKWVGISTMPAIASSALPTYDTVQPSGDPVAVKAVVLTVTVNAAVPAPTPSLPKTASVSGGVDVSVTVLVMVPKLSNTRPLARKTPPTMTSKSMMPSRSVSLSVIEPDPPESNVTSSASAGSEHASAQINELRTTRPHWVFIGRFSSRDGPLPKSK
jgi:hypothetical protein